MTDVVAEVRIKQPREEVAAYMFDPVHDAEWTGGVIEVHPRQEGLLRPGARVERTVRFLGRRFGYEYVVTASQDCSFVEMEVRQPFPMQIRYELEFISGGTLARIRARGDARGFFRLAGPLLDMMVRRNIKGDLERLRRRLEGID